VERVRVHVLIKPRAAGRLAVCEREDMLELMGNRLKRLQNGANKQVKLECDLAVARENDLVSDRNRRFGAPVDDGPSVLKEDASAIRAAAASACDHGIRQDGRVWVKELAHRLPGDPGGRSIAAGGSQPGVSLRGGLQVVGVAQLARP